MTIGHNSVQRMSTLTVNSYSRRLWQSTKTGRRWADAVFTDTQLSAASIKLWCSQNTTNYTMKNHGCFIANSKHTAATKHKIWVLRNIANIYTYYTENNEQKNNNYSHLHFLRLRPLDCQRISKHISRFYGSEAWILIFDSLVLGLFS